MYCAKTGEPIEMPFVGLTLVGPRWCQDWMNLFAAARGNKSAMRPFAKLLWTLDFLSVIPRVCLLPGLHNKLSMNFTNETWDAVHLRLDVGGGPPKWVLCPFVIFATVVSRADKIIIIYTFV